MNDSSLQDVYTLQIRRQVNPDAGSPYCEACKNGFLHVNSIQVRQFTQTGKLPGVCKSCNSAFMRICRLQIRHLTQTEPQPHVCATCNKAFTHAGNYRKHILLHTKGQDGKELLNGNFSPNAPKPPFNCDKCGRNFLKYGSFQKHYQAHDVIKTFTCEICDKVFKSKPLLKSHLRTHKLNQPLHVCKMCKRQFSDIEELEQHLLQHVEDQMNSTIQSKTEASNGGPSEVTIKEEPTASPTKSPKKKKSANIISVKFNSKNKARIVKKPGRKPKQQQSEEKGFSFSALDEKYKHFCSVCQKGFVHLRTLQNHFSKHTGDLAFKCRQCNRKFLHAFNLKKHAKTHKLFGCKMCKKSFKSRGLLNAHVNATHKKK